MTRYEGHAFGKVILLGEHAVVYGRPALAVGISPGASATFEPAAGEPSSIALDISTWNLHVLQTDTTDLARALAALAAHLAERFTSARATSGRVDATIHLPAGGGLGSSAALGVAIARAVGTAWRDDAMSTDDVLGAALVWERVFHGNPSGVDHTVATVGGAGTFTRADGLARIPLRAPLRILLADTAERSSTRTMVEGVARIHARRPEATDRTFDAIETLVHDGARSLRAGDALSLGRAMDLNQALLSSLLLSTERTEELCRIAREAGAFGAKLTGGGGGGCVIALASREGEDRVLDAWRAAGAPTFAAEVTPTEHP